MASPEVWTVCPPPHLRDAELVRYLTPSPGIALTNSDNRNRPGAPERLELVERDQPALFTPIPEATLCLLWVAELFAEAFSCRLVQGAKRPTHAKLVELPLKLSTEEQIAAVCRQLRTRNAFWRADPPILRRDVVTTLPLEDNAVISACGRYRYVLTRQVGPGTRSTVFVMLDPSTADAATDDPTTRRCVGFARQWGCGRLVVLNLFAFRATEPANLKRAGRAGEPRVVRADTVRDQRRTGRLRPGRAWRASGGRTASCSTGSKRSVYGRSPLA